jgi:DNA invertase Pin-like site-specific DNA recombinase
MIKKVIRYVRVSTEAQGNDQSVSIEQQLADIDKLVKNSGWG